MGCAQWCGRCAETPGQLVDEPRQKAAQQDGGGNGERSACTLHEWEAVERRASGQRRDCRRPVATL